MPEPLLQVRDLAVQYRSRPAPALNRISFDLASGEAVGLLGESGAGKTTLARSLIRLLPAGCGDVNGSIRFRQTEILNAAEKQLRTLRGSQISWISQEPELTLSPLMRVGEQIGEVLRAHSRWGRGRRRQEALSMLSDVGLGDTQIYKAYPHQLSGGQRQRVVIAQALILKPSLLIADEPTSALDNVTQAGVIELLKRLQKQFALSLLFVTHNPALLVGLADRVMIMRAGNIVEAGTLHKVYQSPQHPYTRTLIERFPQIPAAFDPASPPTAAVSLSASHCNSKAFAASPGRPVLEAFGLTKVYGRRSPLTGSPTIAIEEVSVALQPASTLALVGKSGSGKSTLARCLAGLETPDAGEIWFRGRNMLSLRKGELRRARRDIQLIFQHSATALNPRLTALETVAEPLRIQGIGTKEQRERAMEVMTTLRISQESANRYPLAFSGGQRQRLALARALILNPTVLVLDEALSGLDIPAQMQIASLLQDVQRKFSLAYLFISHDLPMAALLAGNIAVMDRGKIVEMGPAAEICSDPQCAATRELVASTPALAPQRPRFRIPSPT